MPFKINKCCSSTWRYWTGSCNTHIVIQQPPHDIDFLCRWKFHNNKKEMLTTSTTIWRQSEVLAWSKHLQSVEKVKKKHLTLSNHLFRKTHYYFILAPWAVPWKANQLTDGIGSQIENISLKMCIQSFLYLYGQWLVCTLTSVHLYIHRLWKQHTFY